MSEWTLEPLSNVVSLRRGHDLPATSRSAGEVPVVGSFGITGWHNEAKAKGPGVTIGRSGASYGTAVFVDRDYWPLNTCLYVTDFHGNDPRWVYHLLDDLDFSGFNSGSAQPSLNRNFLAQIPVPSPPLAEQKRIAAVLGAFDDLIETSRELSRRLRDVVWATVDRADKEVPLSELARGVEPRQQRPVGAVEHYSLPAFDDAERPEHVDGVAIKSGKYPINEPTVLVSRLNPKWERCWMAYPGENACTSTEFALLRGSTVADEEVWAVTSASSFWVQMRERVTGTTGSHQRVDKKGIPQIRVPDVRSLPADVRSGLVVQVRTIEALKNEIADLTRTRDELLPLLMSGKIRVEEAEEALT